MTITSVVQSSSTFAMSALTSDPSGKYTSMSPLTLSAGLSGSRSSPVLSRKPECETKNRVMPKKARTVSSGNRVMAPIAPVRCHSRRRLEGASNMASTADFASKFLTAPLTSEARRDIEARPARRKAERRPSEAASPPVNPSSLPIRLLVRARRLKVCCRCVSVQVKHRWDGMA